jgi:glyceraldehyde 3-phosphate dehydrogenase
MSKIRVAINGFGRIGRLSLRNILLKYPRIEVVAVNDLTTPDNLAYLFKNDSTYHKFEYPVFVENNFICIETSDGLKKIQVLAQKDPSQLPWGELQIDVVLECTGRFLTPELANLHIAAGAKKVVLSAPAKDSSIPTVVLGVNDQLLTTDFANNNIISNASCTTNCIAPALKVLTDSFEVFSCFGITVHAYTATQLLQDGPSTKEWRDGRAAAVNTIPSKTGAAKAVELVLPKISGRLNLSAIRVPVITGSMVYVTAQINQFLTKEELNQYFEDAANGTLKGILEYSQEQIVSSDVIKNSNSCLFDSDLTEIMGDKIKIVLWYDNEWGYANRLVDLITKIAQ